MTQIDEAHRKVLEELEAARNLSRKDAERGHVQADIALMEFLVSLGYQDVVDIFDDVGKYYA